MFKMDLLRGGESTLDTWKWRAIRIYSWVGKSMKAKFWVYESSNFTVDSLWLFPPKSKKVLYITRGWANMGCLNTDHSFFEFVVWFWLELFYVINIIILEFVLLIIFFFLYDNYSFFNNFIHQSYKQYLISNYHFKFDSNSN